MRSKKKRQSWEDRKEALLERERLKLRADFINEIDKLRRRMEFQIDILVNAV